jgi:hypothetical protein
VFLERAPLPPPPLRQRLLPLRCLVLGSLSSVHAMLVIACSWGCASMGFALLPGMHLMGAAATRLERGACVSKGFALLSR